MAGLFRQSVFGRLQSARRDAFHHGFLVLVLALIFVLIVPVLWRQLASFIEAMPAYAVKLEGLISAASENLERKSELSLGNNTGPDLGNVANNLVAQAAQWAASFLNSILTRGEALITLVSLLIVTPIVAFYMLLDWHKMISTIDNLIPPRNRKTVPTLARQIDAAMAEFLRGQSLICLCLGIWYEVCSIERPGNDARNCWFG